MTTETVGRAYPATGMNEFRVPLIERTIVDKLPTGVSRVQELKAAKKSGKVIFHISSGVVKTIETVTVD